MSAPDKPIMRLGSHRLFFDAMGGQDMTLTCLTSAQRAAWRHVEETIRGMAAGAAAVRPNGIRKWSR